VFVIDPDLLFAIAGESIIYCIDCNLLYLMNLCLVTSTAETQATQRSGICFIMWFTHLINFMFYLDRANIVQGYLDVALSSAYAILKGPGGMHIYVFDRICVLWWYMFLWWYVFYDDMCFMMIYVFMMICFLWWYVCYDDICLLIDCDAQMRKKSKHSFRQRRTRVCFDMKVIVFCVNFALFEVQAKLRFFEVPALNAAFHMIESGMYMHISKKHNIMCFHMLSFYLLLELNHQREATPRIDAWGMILWCTDHKT